MDDEEPFGIRFLSSLRADLTKTQEQYVFDFFGSVERFLEVGFLYIFEEHPVEIFVCEDSWDDDEFNEGTISIKQEIRIRLKTQEELDHQTRELTEAEKETVIRIWPKEPSSTRR